MSLKPGPEVIKLFYALLNSVEHVILNAHKYKDIKKILVLGSKKPKMLFFPLINVKMPTIVGILTFMSRKKSCSVELSMENVLLPRGPASVCPCRCHYQKLFDSN